MQTRSPRLLLAALACGTTAFAVFRVLAAPQEQPPQSAAKDKSSAPILLAQASPAPTPAGIGSQGGGATDAGANVPPEHKDWKLVWEDDFSKDGGKIDPKKWAFQIDGKGGGNGEAQYYTDDPKNASIDKDGNLVMTVVKEEKEGKHYTSSKLWTKGLYSVMYGRIEACVKAPSAQAGNWPAFWMMPDEPSPYGGWPYCGEIDIMEMVNDAKTLYGTIHYGATWRDKAGSQVTAPAPDNDFSKDFHVYAVEWDKDQFRFYVDGKPYGKVDGKISDRQNQWWTAQYTYPAPFDQKFYLILNFAVGGDWPNNVVTPKRKLPDADGQFPQTMLVKYVRVYQP
ncbi:MAG TPA: glycoside hydrolase family 16 protein [Chthoniobacteraceae bacterium]|nr:glycoside hydrolase family 16 protein [Chthoniobacteraceae bacterium]